MKKRASSTQRQVEDRFADGLCLFKDANGKYCCERQQTERGRCNRHYQRYLGLLRNRGHHEKQEIERKCIEAGTILARHECYSMKRSDCDTNVLEAVL